MNLPQPTGLITIRQTDLVKIIREHIELRNPGMNIRAVNLDLTQPPEVMCRVEYAPKPKRTKRGDS